ncbi:MAG TPA: ATP-grasp domain-containing protein [Edaphobacter sp.]|nr:ATP-grasp domain-containing protein [Edaphobacter sp.]
MYVQFVSIHSENILKVLVLDCEWAAGLETVQSLGRKGITIHAAANKECVAFHSRYVAEKKIQPASVDELATWISEQHRKQLYDLIVPSTERSLMAFLTPHISPEAKSRAVLAPDDSIRLALDKEKTRQLASDLGLYVPATRLVDEHSSFPVQFPVVLKPIHSKSVSNSGVTHHSVTIVRNSGEWSEALRDIYSQMYVQEQEYITGEGIGVEMLFERGEPRWHFVHKRLHEVPLTGGGSSYRQAIEAKAHLVNLAERLLRALQWHGVAMVEFKLTSAGEIFLVEINPRLWGSLALAIDAGVDFPVGLLLLSTGAPLPQQPLYRVGYRTRNLTNDMLWMKYNLVADHSDNLLLTQPRLRSLIEFGRPLLGQESWDFFDIRDVKVTLRIIIDLLAHTTKKARDFFYGHIETWYLSVAQRATLRRIGRRQKRRILFLCYGNICRSPLAEAFARRYMNEEIEVTSAGFHERAARRSPDFMQLIAKQTGTDLSTHSSKCVEPGMIDSADIIVVMDRRNYFQLKRQFPRAIDKTVFLGMFASPRQLEIKDPYDLPFADGLNIGNTIHESVKSMASWMRHP